MVTTSRHKLMSETHIVVKEVATGAVEDESSDTEWQYLRGMKEASATGRDTATVSEASKCAVQSGSIDSVDGGVDDDSSSSTSSFDRDEFRQALHMVEESTLYSHVILLLLRLHHLLCFRYLTHCPMIWTTVVHAPLWNTQTMTKKMILSMHRIGSVKLGIPFGMLSIQNAVYSSMLLFPPTPPCIYNIL